jgi:hypothetical protein
MTTPSAADPTPELPEDEGLTEPELPEVDVEGARLLANEARAELHGRGFTDMQIEAWVRVYFEQGHEGSVEGLLAFITAEHEAGRSV